MPPMSEDIKVKKARYVGMQAIQLNTYVTLKLQNVKSTTVTVKGPSPSWEQDFLFETNDLNTGLLIEVWNRGVIWDKALGYHWLPLQTVAYSDESMARWVELEAHLVMRGGEVVGTTGQTGHALLLDCKFELPFDAENGETEAAVELQRKLDMLNGALDAERAEQARRQMQYITTSGYSEDSDYTSDLNYPVGQHPNCSASQYRSTAHQMHTPQRSLEVSRENSYEDPYLHPDSMYRVRHDDSEPLYYNSRPRTVRDDWSQFQSELQAQASIESAISWQTATEWHSAEDQRRPSLERQDTLYDDSIGFDSYPGMYHGETSQFSHQSSYEEYLDSTTSELPYEVPYQESRVGRRRSSVVQLPQITGRKLPTITHLSEMDGMAPYIPRQRRIAASLPATPPPATPRSRALPVPPSTSRRRRLPQPPAHTHVPYTHTKRSLPVRNYSLEDSSSYYYQQSLEDTANFNNSYQDDDGMQPFFNETPHATPPAGQKAPWSESEITQPFSYELDNTEMSNYGDKSNQYQQASYQQTAKVARKLPRQPTVDYSFPLDESQNHIDDFSQHQHVQRQRSASFIHMQNDSIPGDYEQSHLGYYDNLDSTRNQKGTLEANQKMLTSTDFLQQKSDISIYNQKPLDLQPQRSVPVTTQSQPAAATAVIAGAQSIGRFMFGGAAKLGSLFGAAAAAVQPTVQPVQKVEPLKHTQLHRQDTLVRPTVQRMRSLPGIPVDEQYSETFDQIVPAETADVFIDSENKTEFMDETDNFRYDEPQLDQYNESLYNKQQDEGYREDQIKSPGRESIRSGRKISVGAEVIDSRRSSQQDPYSKLSPTHLSTNGYGANKKSLPNGYAPLERHTTLDEEYLDDSNIKDTNQIPVVSEAHIDGNGYQEERLSFHEERISLRGDNEKFKDEQHDFVEEGIQESITEFTEKDEEEKHQDHVTFKEEPSVTITPKQRWHRAYNKIVMQLNHKSQ